ncbi:thioredoxin-like protein 4A [Leptonychotes weddellii]|uniref:Thioredoxin-like protein 4A n=1 Tax=Leptonychotes weddellii TaxID=9713 RepID=A0A7F8QGK7_LEPWE|nr:thioredoxin-like protein 4A [Leptonychotes weddellii]
MSYMLPHLHNGWQVDQAILSEEDRVVVIRFGHDWDPTCMKMDEVLYSIAEKPVQHTVRISFCLLLGEVPSTFRF